MPTIQRYRQIDSTLFVVSTGQTFPIYRLIQTLQTFPIYRLIQTPLYRNNLTPGNPITVRQSNTFIYDHQVMIIIMPQENLRDLYILPERRSQEIQRGAFNRELYITIRILTQLRRSLIFNQIQTRTINHRVLTPHNMLNIREFAIYATLHENKQNLQKKNFIKIFYFLPASSEFWDSQEKNYKDLKNGANCIKIHRSP